MEFEAPAKALSWCNGHTLVEVGCGLQVLPGLLLQLLSELLPLHRSNCKAAVTTVGSEKPRTFFTVRSTHGLISSTSRLGRDIFQYCRTSQHRQLVGGSASSPTPASEIMRL
ncbi:hypothetical protein EYF80_008621 [Liparis tanakae]|uniref:Uncharacterized protein n=1 Tax=Liparis tanakae TaxID=230148 RepID=A0A4Z2IST4_9TELE|nr:hypothetical protein EYF80_008621 [Liparis tanakae]